MFFISMGWLENHFKAISLLYSGLTSDAASLLTITSKEQLISSIWDCFADNDRKLSLTSAQILVNLTSLHTKYTAPLDLISKLLPLLHKADAMHLYNSIAMILNNTSSSGILADEFSKLVNISDCQNFIKLLSQSMEQGYLSAVLGNLAVTEHGRKLLMDESVFSNLVSFLTMPGNIIVRRNTARLMRNISFDVKSHITLSHFLPQLVYPLTGGEEIDEDDMEKLPLDLQYLPEDKSRESDLETRVFISDILFQMCSSYFVRKLLREQNYYILLRKYDEWEDSSEGKDRVQNVIYLIIQDDGEVDLRKDGELPTGIEVLEMTQS